MKVMIDADIEDLVIRFLEKRREDCDLLKSLYEAKDIESLKSVGHRISGTSASYGFEAIAVVARGIETAAEGNNLEAIKVLIDKYVEIVEKTSYECR